VDPDPYQGDANRDKPHKKSSTDGTRCGIVYPELVGLAGSGFDNESFI
jgi:hypothetical protein